MIDLFERQVVKCRSINQFNRLHIALESRLTPLEVRDLSRLIAGRYSTTPSVFWIERLRKTQQRGGKIVPEGYMRKRLKPSLYLYSGQGIRSEKTLVIGFTGRGGRRLLVPIADFLQNMNSSTTDVLMVSHSPKSNYSNGIIGLGSSFGEVLSILRGTIESLGYRRMVSFGASLGGLPAMLAAIHLDLERGVCAGGAPIDEKQQRWILEDEAFRSIFQNWNGRPEFLSIFSAEHEKDRNAAIELQKILPLLLWPVADNKQHNALYNHYAAGTLSSLLQKTLIAEWTREGEESGVIVDLQERLRRSQVAVDQLRLQDQAVLCAKRSSIKKADLYRRFNFWFYTTGRMFLPDEAMQRIAFYVRKTKAKVRQIFTLWQAR